MKKKSESDIRKITNYQSNFSTYHMRKKATYQIRGLYLTFVHVYNYKVL